MNKYTSKIQSISYSDKYLEKNEVAKGNSEWKERPPILNRAIRRCFTSEGSNLSLSDLKMLLSPNQNKEKEPTQIPEQLSASFCLLF